MGDLKQEWLPSRPWPPSVKDEPSETRAPKEELSPSPTTNDETTSYSNTNTQPTYIVPWESVIKDEPGRVNPEEDGYDDWASHTQAEAQVRFRPNPIDERERETIRRLLDVPEVDIPVWQRQREPTAMNKKLMAHQRVGLTWLVNQEQSPHKGGILADDMGLGKTIQALALILARPPEDGTRKTTLIVVPTALLHQWEQEISDKVKPGHKLKTLIFHGQKKRRMTVARLLSHDVVLTTYGALAHEWKAIYEHRQIDKAMLLAPHAIFHRVILDEAHNIKNRNSQASMAVDRLRSTYRLCMTGTPLMNRLDELYPLVRFLRIKPHCEWEIFRRTLRGINSNDSASMKQIHVLLSRILLRRTEKTIIDGQPILTLPPLKIGTVQAVFDKDQLEYYQALEQRSQIKMNRYLKAGTVTRHYWYILLLILRLRQCCCHPYLLKDHTIPEGVHMTPEEMNKLALKLDKRVVERVASLKSFDCPLCGESIERPIIIHPCGHHICGDCLTNMIADSEPEARFDDEDEISRVGDCPQEGCHEIVHSKNVICYKNFADIFLEDDDREDCSEDVESEDDEDDESADENGDLKDFIVSDDHETDEDGEWGDEEGGEAGGDKGGDVGGEEGGNESAVHSRSPVGERPGLKSELESSPPREQAQEEEDEGVAHGSDVDHVDGNQDFDDSDCSLPPLDSLFAHMKKKAVLPAPAPAPKPRALATLPESKQHNRNNVRPPRRSRRTGASDAESDGNDEDVDATPGGKRAKSFGKGLARPAKKIKTGKRKKQATALTLSALKKAGSNSAKAKESYFKSLRKDWETSAKVDVAMELLKAIRSEFPNEKTLVFSQFTSFLDLMEIPISDDGYNYRRYDGSMSNGDRNAAVADFMTKPEVKVLLVSLRCGNAGLNLYAATRVIMLDPFWNPSVEDQAIKRAHRLGQTQPVMAYRILVQQTIEDRILALQAKKRELVDSVLDPDARKSVSRLSVSELAGLFGINWTGS